MKIGLTKLVYGQQYSSTTNPTSTTSIKQENFFCHFYCNWRDQIVLENPFLRLKISSNFSRAGGSGRRVLRCRGQREVRAANGVHGDHDVVERTGVREATGLERGARPRHGSCQVGHWLLHQSPPQSSCPLWRGNFSDEKQWKFTLSPVKKATERRRRRYVEFCPPKRCLKATGHCVQH